MKRYLAFLSLVGALCFATTYLGAAEDSAVKDKVSAEDKAAAKAKRKEELAKILKETKCPMSGKPVNAEKTVAYKDSKVYLCCGGCVKGFDGKLKSDETLAAKANHQLVATKQARQVKCAMNGKGKVNKKTLTKFAGTEVGFCCKNCQGKFTDMEEAERVQVVFGKNFEKAFVVKAQKRKENKKAKEKKAA